MARRKCRAPENLPLNQEPPKRVQRPEKEKQKPSRPSFLDAKTMVKVHVSDSVDSASDSEDVDDSDESQGETETFLVHEAFICRYSPFFDAAFNGNFEEGKTQELHLRDTNPAVFSILMDWLYTQNVTPIKSDTDEVVELHMLISLWVLADKLLVPRLQNETLRVFDERRTSLGRLASNSCQYVYNNTSDGSPLRRYMSYLASRRIETVTGENLSAHRCDCWPREMLIDIIKEMRNPTGKVKSEARLSQEHLLAFYVPEDHKDASARVTTN